MTNNSTIDDGLSGPLYAYVTITNLAGLAFNVQCGLHAMLSKSDQLNTPTFLVLGFLLLIFAGRNVFRLLRLTGIAAGRNWYWYTYGQWVPQNHFAAKIAIIRILTVCAPQWWYQVTKTPHWKRRLTAVSLAYLVTVLAGGYAGTVWLPHRPGSATFTAAILVSMAYLLVPPASFAIVLTALCLGGSSGGTANPLTNPRIARNLAGISFLDWSTQIIFLVLQFLPQPDAVRETFALLGTIATATVYVTFVPALRSALRSCSSRLGAITKVGVSGANQSRTKGKLVTTTAPPRKNGVVTGTAKVSKQPSVGLVSSISQADGSQVSPVD